MNWNDYELAAERTEKKFSEGKQLNQMQMELLHAAIGISTEAGEILDAFKKHLIYGKELDLVNIGEEISDVTWYLSIITRYLEKNNNVSFEDLLDMNIDKLKSRYPEQFTEEKALNRDLDTEREILESVIDSPDGC